MRIPKPLQQCKEYYFSCFEAHLMTKLQVIAKKTKKMIKFVAKYDKDALPHTIDFDTVWTLPVLSVPSGIS